MRPQRTCHNPNADVTGEHLREVAKHDGGRKLRSKGRNLARTTLLAVLPLVGTPLLVTAQSVPPDAPSQPAAPEREPTSPLERIRELESDQSPPAAELPPLPLMRPKEKTQQQLRQLEERRMRGTAAPRERLTPQERAREKIRQLDQAAPGPDSHGAADEAGLDPTGPSRTPPFRSDGGEEPGARERVKLLLGVYDEGVGIYDEILDKTKIGPGLLHDALGAPDWLTLGGEQRTRYEGLSGSWRTADPDGGQVLAMRTRLQVGVQNVIDPVRFLIEIQDSRAPLTTTGSYINTDHVNELDILQLHLSLVSNNFLGTKIPTVLKVGRLNMEVGRGRWVGRNDFRNTTNAFDGIHWQLGDEREWQVRAFLLQPVQRFFRKPDPLATEQDNTFWGAYFESRRRPWMESTLHYFGHSSVGPGRDFTMLGGRIRKRAAAGELDYELESSYQFGNLDSQRTFAHFQHAEVGYTADLPWAPQVSLRFDYAANGFDVLYGRRSFEMHPTGIFGPFQRSNILSPGARVLVTPFEQGYVFLQYRAWWLADDRGAWVGSGLQDVGGGSGNFVGHTLELRARHGLGDNLFLQAGYAFMAFGPFAERAPGSPVDGNAHYGYLWTEFAF